MPPIQQVLETCIYSRDLRAMERIYVDVIGLSRVSDNFPRGMGLRAGPQSVLLIFDSRETVKQHETVPAHGAEGPGHFAFSVPVGALDAWRAHLVERGFEIEREVARESGAESIYVRDPAGNSVEFVAGDLWRLSTVNLNERPGDSILAAGIDEFRKTKKLAERCFEQLAEDDFHVRINPHQNSVAAIMQHMAGNMLSRWTDFLTTDGEKPNRDREGEFAERRLSRAQLMERWEQGWTALFAALAGLSDADLFRVVTIRNEPHTVFHAINRQAAHYNLHLGQIQLIGKHLRSDAWKYLSIPPGGTAEFNASKVV